MKRAEIEAELLRWMALPWRADEERFARLALALFAHQFAHCEPYRRFCISRGANPDETRRWQEVPAVPTGAFKSFALRSFPEADTVGVFRTSGTSTSERGTLYLDSYALYEASLVPSFERGLLPDLDGRVTMLILAASRDEQPDSSLSHMFDVMLERRGRADSVHLVRDGALDREAALAALGERSGGEEPLLVCGTAFAFVHLLEFLEERGVRLTLGPGARVMETGGFKGRSRAYARDDLYRLIEDRLGVPANRIVNQYGMTELGSQFYDSVLRETAAPRRKCVPPWVRVQILDPQGEEPVPAGAIGVIRILDLANTGSVAAIQTADLGRAVADGFEVLGRAEGAEARGCSVAADAMFEVGRV